jgi:hypothetical protein
MNGREVTTAPVKVADAIADLAGLRSSDPAARHAVHAIRLTRLTLESFWVDERRPDDDTDDDDDDDD